MEAIDIILNSRSVGDAALKIYGCCNGKIAAEVREILYKNGFTIDIFKELRDNINTIDKTCPVCKKIFNVRIKSKQGKNVCCSITCSNSYNPKRIKKLVSTKRSKIKREIKKYDRKCQKCDSDYTGSIESKFCSPVCRNKHLSETMKMNIKKGICKGWQTRNIESYPEKFFKTVLSNNNIDFILNYPVSKKLLGADSDAYYFIDFYIIKDGKNIDLEIDGKQHKYKDRKDSDTERDTLLKKNGYLVHRIEWNEINSNSGKIRMEEKINRFLEFYNK